MISHVYTRSNGGVKPWKTPRLSTAAPNLALSLRQVSAGVAISLTAVAGHHDLGSDKVHEGKFKPKIVVHAPFRDSGDLSGPPLSGPISVEEAEWGRRSPSKKACREL